MKATVSTNQSTEPTIIPGKKKGIFGGREPDQRGPDRVTGYYVNVQVEFTEEERAILTRTDCGRP